MKICVPIKQEKSKLVLKELKLARKSADLVEIWFDEIIDFSDRNARLIEENASKPLLYKVTSFSIQRILSILKLIKKIDYLDIDISTDKKLVTKIRKIFPHIEIIISYHNFQNTPSLPQLFKLVEQMKKMPADIIKIAAHANSISDSLRMLSFLSQQSNQKQKFICLCMGKYGRITRLAGHLVGNYLMYAPMSAAHITASGQLTIHELQKILKSIS